MQRSSSFSSICLFAAVFATGCGVSSPDEAKTIDAAPLVTVTATATVPVVLDGGTVTLTQTVTQTDTVTAISTATATSTASDAASASSTATATATSVAKSDAGASCDVQSAMALAEFQTLAQDCQGTTFVCSGGKLVPSDPSKCVKRDAGSASADASIAPGCVNGKEQVTDVSNNGITCRLTQTCVEGAWQNSQIICSGQPNSSAPDASAAADAFVAKDALLDTKPECAENETKACSVGGAFVAVFCLGGRWPACPVVVIDGGTLDTQGSDTTPVLDTQAPDTQTSDATSDSSGADSTPDSTEAGGDAVGTDAEIACQVGSPDVACTMAGCSTYAVRHCMSGKLQACTCVHADYPGPAIMDCQKDSLGKYTFTLWGLNQSGLLPNLMGLEGGFFHSEYGQPTKLCLAGSHNNWSRGINCDSATSWAPLQTYQFTESTNMNGAVINLVGVAPAGERWGDEDPYVTAAQATMTNPMNLGTIMPAGICSLAAGGFRVNQ